MEALCLLDGKVQLLDKLLIALVRRQVETVEAGVTAWQPRVLADLLDAESLRPIAPHEFGEAANRKSTCSGDEL